MKSRTALLLAEISFLVFGTFATAAESIPAKGVAPAGRSGGKVSTDDTACRSRTLEAQFIGDVSSVPAGKNPVRSDANKGILCKFRMARLAQFSPATGSCPFYDKGRLTENDLEVWVGKGESCPEVGDMFSGVAQLNPAGQLAFDAGFSGKCRGKVHEAQFIGKISSVSNAGKPVDVDPKKGVLCKFHMDQLQQFSPAVGACPFFDEARIKNNELEAWTANKSGCPSSGDSFSGVVKLLPSGKLSFDADFYKDSK